MTILKRIAIVAFAILNYTVFGQVEKPLDPNINELHCSRMQKSQVYGVAEPHHESHDNHKAARAESCSTSAAEWASMSTSALIAALKQGTTSECFNALFTIDTYYAPSTFSNNNIYAVASQVYNQSVNYDGTKSSGMYGLLYYLHAASYQDFYNDRVNMNTSSINRLILAGESLTNNPNLWKYTADALDILDEYLIILDFPGLRHKASVLSVVKRVFYDLAIANTWKQVPVALHRSYARAYNRVFFLMFRGMQDDAYIQAVNGDNTLFSRLYSVANNTELKNNEEFAFMVGNAVLEMSRSAQSPLLIDDVEYYLAQIAINNNRLSPSWLKAVEAINKYGNCAAYSLCENIDDLRIELENMLFPNLYKFDDGKMVVKTPLIEEEVQELYHAAKQTQSQFYRMIQTSEPVAGDINDTLTMVVFGSKKDYEDYATYLYGIPTNNGGMYIERGATFYTWDRTVGVESSLSLEALFRHEYVHYLQGRYLIQGYWAENPIYNNSRMVWYEEGMAEFFAGSTDTEGIKLLASNVNVVKNSNGSWPSLSDVFNSSYTSGNFNHYYYGNMVWYNLYLNDFDKLKTFFDLTRNDDISGFDNLVNNLRSSGGNQFNTFLSSVANDEVTGWEPETNWLDDDYLAIGQINDIKNEFTTLTGNNQVTVSIDASALNRRFRVTGSISGQQNASNNEQAAKQINQALDELLNTIRSNQLLNNFTYSIGHFENLSYGAGIPTADFIITGPLRDSNVSDTPVPDFAVDRNITIVGGSVNFENKSNGYVKSLSWTFEGGDPQFVNDDSRPGIVYNSQGTYDVSLTASNETSSSTSQKTDFIKVYNKNTNTYCPGSGQEDYNYISGIQFGAIESTSLHEGYGDFTSYVTELRAGESETLKIFTRNDHWELNVVGAWIDWNRDGDFDDNGESIYGLMGEGPYTSTIQVPQNASNGVTTMRLRLAYGNEDKMVACGDDTYLGEVEDYSVVVLGGDNTPADIPVASFQASSVNVTTGASVSFTDGSSNEPAAWSWFFEGGTPSTSTAQNPVVTYNTAGSYDVQLIVSNTAGADTLLMTDYITVSTATNEYCSSGSDRSTYEYIASVSVNDFTHTSGATNYSDFTDKVVPLSIGSNAVTLVPGFSGDSYAEYFRVWVDFNGDGDFTDSGELAFDAGSTSATTVTGVLTVPTNAIEGPSRMRVSMKYNGAPSACENFADGEVEDYTADISTGTATSPSAPSGLSASVSSATSISLEWTDNASTETGFEIERSVNGGSYSVVNTTGANVNSYEDTGLSASTSYSYRVRAKNGAGYSAYSNTSSATTPGQTVPEYCVASAGNPSGQYIKTVSAGSISNNSSYDAGGYTDYTTLSTSVGTSLTLTVTPHTKWAGTRVKGWVDWNRDGDFTDSGEEVYSVSGTGNYERTISVPSGVSAGSVVLRVRAAHGQAPTPCGAIHFSETEDYTLNIGFTSLGRQSAYIDDFTVYPNPVEGTEINIRVPDYDGDLVVNIYSIDGTLVYQKPVEKETYSKLIQITLDKQLHGMYLLNVSGNEFSVTRKVNFK
ncbi:collagenase [Fulvivirga ulvae]|uniref:GEVED domain-containing protein n=1 Tax=Fulvivirga ulvae TaxID=2904245 RepID=UPI001F20A8B2|nr:GEVED domain-containing protein [Fulvivirga ulvae]UII35013.1 collagenase [Fulvivirga ulvae]